MTIDRRRFLQGAGALLSLPFLESRAGNAQAGRGAGPPKRLVSFYAPQGHPYPAIRDPTTLAGGGYQLNDVFQQPVDTLTGQLATNVQSPSPTTLADFKEQMTIITGMSVASANAQGGNAHNLAAGHSLVGQAMQPMGPNENHTLSGGASIDDLISNRITPPSVAFQALHASVLEPWEICFTGPGEPVSRISEPDQLAQWLFGDFINRDVAAIAKRRARRQSVVDATKDNIAWLRGRISASDRHRLDAYLERMQGIEQRINAGIAGESCTPLGPLGLERSPLRDQSLVEVPDFDPWYDPDVSSPAIIDCMVEPLACDRTRVATVTYSDYHAYFWMRYLNGELPATGYAGPNYPNAGQSGNWHNDVVHAFWPQSDPDSVPAYEQQVLGDFLQRAARWEMAQFAYLLSKLASKQEGSGSLLDNTVVLYLNEFGGQTHSHDDMMYIVAGGGGGSLQQGQWLRLDGEPHNRLLMTLLRAFDIDDVSTFGDPQWCSGGPISQMLA